MLHKSHSSKHYLQTKNGEGSVHIFLDLCKTTEDLLLHNLIIHGV